MIRFLHEYLQCDNLNNEHKQLIDEIIQKARRIALHDHNRIIKRKNSIVMSIK